MIEGPITGSAVADASVTAAKIASNAVTTAKIANDAVTFSKIQNVTANKLLGSVAGGDTEEIACTSAGRSMIAATDAAAQLALTGGAAAAHTHVSADITDLVTGGAVRFQPAVWWTRDNVLANLTQTPLLTNVPNFSTWQPARAGSVVAITLMFSDAVSGAITAGTLTLEIALNGGAANAHNATYTSLVRLTGGTVTFAAGDIPYVADDVVQMLLTTTAGFTPSGSVKIRVFLEVEEAP